MKTRQKMSQCRNINTYIWTWCPINSMKLFAINEHSPFSTNYCQDVCHAEIILYLPLVTLGNYWGLHLYLVIHLHYRMLYEENQPCLMLPKPHMCTVFPSWQRLNVHLGLLMASQHFHGHFLYLLEQLRQKLDSRYHQIKGSFLPSPLVR